MSDVVRVSAADARNRVQTGSALLVCAYDNDEKFQKMRLEGAISLAELRARSSILSKDQEIIFYCA